ncbi:MAG: hypothetical protein ABIH41_06360 [Nanoarchaeota archaeon]
MLHQFLEVGVSDQQVMAVDLDEVAEFFEQRSPFRQIHSTIDDALDEYMGAVNFDIARVDEGEARPLYIIGCVGYKFLGPLLGVDLQEKKDRFDTLVLRRFKVLSPQTLHLAAQDESGYTLDDLVKVMREHPLFAQRACGFSRAVYEQSERELRKLEEKYSLDQHVLAAAYVFMLNPAFGSFPDENGQAARFYEATQSSVSYNLLIPTITA